MSDYLRDTALNNLLITEDRLIELHNLLNEIIEDANSQLLENDIHRLELNFILRFDNKGFTLKSMSDVLRYFKHARKVQKLIVSVTTHEHAANPYVGRFRVPYDHHGKCIYIHLARDEAAYGQGPNFERQIQNQPSYLIVTDDSSGWTEGNFSRIKERLDMYKSMSSSLIRAPWFPVALTLIFGILTFTVALLGSLWLSGYFSASAAPAAIFVLILLVLNPAITALHKPTLVLVDYFYPNIAFREVRAHWIIQGMIAIAGAAIIVTVGSLLYKFLATAIQPYLK